MQNLRGDLQDAAQQLVGEIGVGRGHRPRIKGRFRKARGDCLAACLLGFLDEGDDLGPQRGTFQRAVALRKGLPDGCIVKDLFGRANQARVSTRA